MEKLRSGLKMAESKSSKDSARYKVVSEELKKFNKLVKGHEKLLKATGEL